MTVAGIKSSRIAASHLVLKNDIIFMTLLFIKIIMDVFFVLGAEAHNRIGLVPLCLFIAKGQTFLCLGWGAVGA